MIRTIAGAAVLTSMLTGTIVTRCRTGEAHRASVRRHINIAHRIDAPFSDGVEVGDTLYLAGRTGHDASGAVPSDPGNEAQNVLEGVKSVLASGGMTTDDLVLVQVFCTDMTLFDKWNRIYRESLGKDLPAYTFIGVSSLQRGAHFEMQAIAVRR